MAGWGKAPSQPPGLHTTAAATRARAHLQAVDRRAGDEHAGVAKRANELADVVAALRYRHRQRCHHQQRHRQRHQYRHRQRCHQQQRHRQQRQQLQQQWQQQQQWQRQRWRQWQQAGFTPSSGGSRQASHPAAVAASELHTQQRWQQAGFTTSSGGSWHTKAGTAQGTFLAIDLRVALKSNCKSSRRAQASKPTVEPKPQTQPSSPSPKSKPQIQPSSPSPKSKPLILTTEQHKSSTTLSTPINPKTTRCPSTRRQPSSTTRLPKAQSTTPMPAPGDRG
eukprot:366252-Chlamydomonas_euryale.AAC.3